MARPIAATQLENKYARLMGALQVIDHEVEPVIGVVAIIEKQLEIERRKQKMLAEARAITASIRLFEPDWNPEKVKAIVTKPRIRKHGQGARAVYRLLKRADRPLTTWEIGKAIAPDVGVEAPDHRELMRLSSLAHGTCQRALKRGLVELHVGKPNRWATKRLGAAASSHTTA